MVLRENEETSDGKIVGFVGRLAEIEMPAFSVFLGRMVSEIFVMILGNCPREITGFVTAIPGARSFVDHRAGKPVGGPDILTPSIGNAARILGRPCDAEFIGLRMPAVRAAVKTDSLSGDDRISLTVTARKWNLELVEFGEKLLKIRCDSFEYPRFDLFVLTVPVMCVSHLEISFRPYVFDRFKWF